MPKAISLRSLISPAIADDLHADNDAALESPHSPLDWPAECNSRNVALQMSDQPPYK